MSYPASTCIYCGQSSQTVPLVQFEYQGNPHWICAQHFPILIHKPALLAEKLPGFEQIEPAEGHE